MSGQLGGDLVGCKWKMGALLAPRGSGTGTDLYWHGIIEHLLVFVL